MTKTIRIAAALVLRPDGDTLLVRKRGTAAFMQPGGKVEPQETAEKALVRELFEELGLAAETKDLIFIGRFQAPAANEPDHTVIADIFRLHVGDAAIAAAAEIEEIRWVSPHNPGHIAMAPLTEHHILPHYRQQTMSAGR
ncbi:NUDIX domain-containing protein [Rhizobium sp. P40RR-XXII]|uniref:NUDIX hydrolase n=1 Tax=unclassified Rhizobium TaxID=2613769 RepID=UPI0014563E4B|nr:MULTISPECIES: NUDIX domain-containing protein [unclassified Rhizobium]NLR86762.1 NUDIX domain-containing protein [Rhizobium sp. P28RR-XV]NLS17433.1 NUDIX domain-containing protein [Rhizobium sp. P40RR-XXII]